MVSSVLIICCTTIVIALMYFIFERKNVVSMTECDKNYHKHETKGDEKKEEHGRLRNRWDFSICPTLQKVGMKVDPKLILATLLMVVLLVIWFITKEDTFLELVKINFGALLGTLIASNDNS